jgi:hypothetical protein
LFRKRSLSFVNHRANAVATTFDLATPTMGDAIVLITVRLGQWP